MAMDRMDSTMITTITGTTIIIGLGGDIIDIALGILGHITLILIITDGHTTAHIMHIIPITIMATTLTIIITDQFIIQTETSM